MKNDFRSAKLSESKGTVGAALLIGVIAFSIIAISTSSAQLTFQGRACSGNSICDVIRKCDASGCTSRFENCQACGSTPKVCPNGVATAPNTCVDSGGTPQCKPGTPVCSGALGTTDPHVILTFTVFTRKNLVISVTPDTQTALAGKTLNYKIAVENKNPKQLTFQVTSDIPAGWEINLPATTTVAANSKADVQFRVTSSSTASDASYPILIGMFNSELNLFGTATANYIVASRGAPTIATTPKSQSGYPGQSLFYNVSVTNNDPADFDASTANLRADVPDGFNAVFTPNSIKLSPQETNYVRLDVTSPANATEASYGITINASINRLAAVDFIEYKIDFCGDSICEIGEEGSCGKDCPQDGNFICNGRCERELDDGLAFTATVNVPYNRFVVCSRNSSLQACTQAAGRAETGSNFAGLNITTNITSNCGIGKACLCASPQSNCNALCVDNKGVYYLAASNANSSVRGVVNWSYACPFVDLPEIKALREDFAKARNEYEKAQSALKESLKAPNTTSQRRAEGQPCIDALSTIISDVNAYVKYLDDVIAWPGKTNTTAARLKAVDIRRSIEVTYNIYCRGASGLLQIESITAAPVEKGETGQIVVTTKNIGNTPYYGFVQCDFTGAAGEKQQQNSSCTPIGSTGTASGFEINATSAGKWTARCSVFGSLITNCSLSAVHHSSTAQFNVSTREAFVVDVSGSCIGSQNASASAANLTCSVRGSQPDCVACRLAAGQCSRITSANGTSVFNCPKTAFGNFTLFGYVLSNDRCKPSAPAEKNITVRCPGCGDGVVEGSEQCENPYSNNNQRCGQSQTTCEGKLFGIRDGFGFCSTNCMCSPDQYEFSCSRGQCGAECADGETKIVTINKTTGACSCTQQCNSACGWNACDCEPGSVQIIAAAASTGPPTINITHSPSSPTNGIVALTATATNTTLVEIYVDGFVVKSCSTLTCSLTATFDPGTHSYFGRATNSFSTVTDPTQGAKSFNVPSLTSSGNQTAANQTNRTTTTNNSISLTLSHSPQNPTTLDIVIITASASSNANRIDIYVDGFLQKSCNEFVCSLSSRYPAGNHTYFSIASDNSGSVSNPLTGSRTFLVTQAAGGGANGTGALATTSIIVDVSHSPLTIDTDDTVTVTAIAHGPRSFREVNIFIDETLKKTCTNLPSSQPCSFRSAFSEGTHSYFASVIDVTNNSGRDPQSGSKSFSVSKAQPAQSNATGPGPSIGSGIGSGTTTASSATGRCYAKIDDRNCTYNTNTRRYDLKIAATWDNGTHAHWVIDGSPGQKMYQKNFTHVEPLSGPGAKSLRVEVHNVNDSLLCSDSTEIYCGPGSTSGKDLDIIIDVKDVVKTGLVDVRIIAAAYVNINALRLSSYVESPLNVSNVRLEGNTSLASVSGPVRVSEDKTYNVYTATTNMNAGKNISLNYKLRIDKAGEFKLIAIANYSTTQRVTKTIKATSCAQAFSVLAAGPSGACLSFTTPCDVPPGWNQVERCPGEAAVQKEEGSIWPLVIVVLIIAVIAALAYRNRDAIRERLQNMRRGKGAKEELPRFEEE